MTISMGKLDRRALSVARDRRGGATKELSPLASRCLRVAVFVAFLIVWQLVSGRLIRKILISRPSDVWNQLWKWIADGSLAGHIRATAAAAVMGFLLGAAVGILVGYMLASLRRTGHVLQPFMTALYTLPRLALAPMFIMWFGLGLQFKVMFSATIVFFLVYFTTRQGVEEVSTEMIRTAQVLGASRFDIAVRVVLPSALIWVVTGLKISVPYALVGVVVGEMLVGDTGLGFLIAQSANRFQPSGLFAAVVVLLALAVLTDATLQFVTSKFLRWKTAGEGTRSAAR